MRTTLTLLAAAVLTLTGCSIPSEDPTAVQPAESGESGGELPKAAPPVKLTATKTAFKKQEFVDAGPHTCARVTVTNNSKKNVEVNPFYFAVTGTDGEKRNAATGVARGEFDSLTLAPGEKASGTVCTETTSPPKVITFTDPTFAEAARAEVG
jgi:Domain of unknown function (DUF4352)